MPERMRAVEIELIEMKQRLAMLEERDSRVQEQLDRLGRLHDDLKQTLASHLDVPLTLPDEPLPEKFSDLPFGSVNLEAP